MSSPRDGRFANKIPFNFIIHSSTQPDVWQMTPKDRPLSVDIYWNADFNTVRTMPPGLQNVSLFGGTPPIIAVLIPSTTKCVTIYPHVKDETVLSLSINIPLKFLDKDQEIRISKSRPRPPLIFVMEDGQQRPTKKMRLSVSQDQTSSEPTASTSPTLTTPRSFTPIILHLDPTFFNPARNNFAPVEEEVIYLHTVYPF